MINAPLPEAPDEVPQEYLADVSFDDLKLSPELRRAVAERGYTHPTPVQAKAFQPVMEGRDLIVRSKTGTGKTAAFGLPLIERIPLGTRQVRALILCPTRELALQVTQELEALAKHRDIRVTAIYGGASMKQQEDALTAGSAIIVGTPGRVHDHIRRGNLKLNGCAHAVLDEADEMLNQGFYEEVTRILDCLPTTRQVLLFSATVPADIQRLITKYTTNAETLLLSGDVYTVDHIQHVGYEISDAFPKPRNLLYVLELEEPDNAIIFCNRRDDTELVTAVLNRNGFDAELLNGDLPQKERERVMGKIKRGEVAYMVATDLAARGIDISDLGHVINYSLPEDPAVYLHRVGRTGRIGKKGVALNLLSGRELATLTALERRYSINFERRQMPTPEEATRLWTERHVRELKDAAQGTILEGLLALAAELKRRPDADELIAYMLRYFFTHRRMERLQHGEPSEDADRATRDGRTQPAPSSQGRARRERGGERGGRGGRGKREDRDGRRSDERAARPPREERGRRSPRHDEVPPSVEHSGPPIVAAVSQDAASEVRLPEEGRRDDILDLERTPSRPRGSAEAVAHSLHAEAARVSDRQLFESLRASPSSKPASAGAGAETEPTGEREGRRPRREGGRREHPKGELDRPVDSRPPERHGLSDRELFEALQSGKPLPLIDDPTRSAARRQQEASEPRATEDSGERTDRSERTERTGRRERRPRGRQERAPVEVAPGTTRLWVNLGRVDHVDEAGLSAALESAGAPAGRVKKTEVRGTFSYVHVADADVGDFEALIGKQVGEKALKVERARS